MARGAYFDCFGGASGDMLLGALIDAGVELEALRHGLSGLPIAGWTLEAERVALHGLRGTRAKVVVESDDQPHRGLSEIGRLIQASTLPSEVTERACRVFERLAEAEAFIHGTSPNEVEFHEMSAVDSIVDVVGVVLGLHLLSVDWSRLTCSGLPLGSGWVQAAHGRLPVPAPATLELIKRGAAPLRAAPRSGETGELTTPTAAALLTVLARFTTAEEIGRIEAVGYGFGTREPEWPNA